MTKYVRPGIVLPGLLSVALLLGLLAVGNVGAITALLRGFHLGDLLVIVVLLAGYEAVQGLQWHVLLRALGLRVSLRAQAFAYLLGQPTRVLPIGNFVENAILLRTTGTDFGLSSAATLLSVLIEVAVSLLGLALLGLGPWTWLRPLIVIGLAVFLPAAWAVATFYHARSLPAWLARRRGVQAALAELRQFRAGAARLARPGVLVRGGLLGALYLLLGGTTLYVVLRGLGVATLSWEQVLGVYFFSLAFALIAPLPIDFGVTETGGAAALLVLGVDQGAAVGAMLLLRALSIGVALVIAALSFLVLHDETRVLARRRPHPPLVDAPIEARPLPLAPGRERDWSAARVAPHERRSGAATLSVRAGRRQPESAACSTPAEQQLRHPSWEHTAEPRDRQESADPCHAGCRC